MGWYQTRNFNVNKMGRKKGMCLQNCRLGFGITSGKYASAKKDMEAQRKAGTLHSINSLPKNLAVPVYVDSNSQYEHIVVYNNGTWYSDGKKISGWKATGHACFGWGELCDGVRVVAWKNDPKPQPSGGFLPKRGYWISENGKTKGDTDPRIGRMASFLRKKFPAYTPPQALGNYFGKNLRRSVMEFQRRTGLVADGNVGAITYAKLKQYGFGG